MEIEDIDFVASSQEERKMLEEAFEKYFPVEVIKIQGPEKNEFFAKREKNEDTGVCIGLIPRYEISGLDINLHDYKRNATQLKDLNSQKKREINYAFHFQKDGVTIDPVDANRRLTIYFK